MAHIDVTTNKNGRLQAKIMFYGKDAVTQKTKLLSRRIYNDDNLTEAKFRRYAEKVAKNVRVARFEMVRHRLAQ